jgi:hypothetical protein
MKTYDEDALYSELNEFHPTLKVTCKNVKFNLRSLKFFTDEEDMHGCHTLQLRKVKQNVVKDRNDGNHI